MPVAGCMSPSRRSKKLLLGLAAVLSVVYVGSLGRQIGASWFSDDSAAAVEELLGGHHHHHHHRQHDGQHHGEHVGSYQEPDEHRHRHRPAEVVMAADAAGAAAAAPAAASDPAAADPVVFGGGGCDWSSLCGRLLGQCTKPLCDGSFIAVGNEFALLQDVVVTKQHGRGRMGGERIEEVVNQDENAEYWELKPGFFDLGGRCAGDKIAGLERSYAYNKNSHLNKWLAAVVAKDDQPAAATSTDAVPNFTNAVMRYEYVNLYHTMTDFYNAYLVAKYFGQRPENMTVLFVDGHPAGSLDVTWSTLFAGYVRVGQLPPAVRYAKLAWGWLGYASPLMNHGAADVPPLLDEFRLYFLERHGIRQSEQEVAGPAAAAAAPSPRRDCARPRILFVWRRDYVAHPRNPIGIVSRKVKNEEELLSAVRARYPLAAVSGQQTDLLPMGEQLALVSNADVLVGMHGAGLTLALFLPPGGGLVELYPTYWSINNEHFKAIARWRRLSYANWQNGDPSLEDDQKRSHVPPHTLVSLVEHVMRGVCPQQP